MQFPGELRKNRGNPPKMLEVMKLFPSCRQVSNNDKAMTCFSVSFRKEATVFTTFTKTTRIGLGVAPFVLPDPILGFLHWKNISRQRVSRKERSYECFALSRAVIPNNVSLSINIDLKFRGAEIRRARGTGRAGRRHLRMGAVEPRRCSKISRTNHRKRRETPADGKNKRRVTMNIYAIFGHSRSFHSDWQLMRDFSEGTPLAGRWDRTI